MNLMCACLLRLEGLCGQFICFFRFVCRDNYGFVTYMDTEDAKRAIEGTQIDTDVITTTDKL